MAQVEGLGDPAQDMVRKTVIPSSAQAATIPLSAHDQIAVLREALIAAKEHLEYCGYGDKWERELARDSKLEEQIADALKRTL